MMVSRMFCAALALWAGQVMAETQPDAYRWLSRMASSSQRLCYTGTFVYQAGKRIETSRIAHRSDKTGEFERLESLDGAPREIVRSNQDVKVYFPRERMVVADRVTRPRFPALNIFSPTVLADHYLITLGGEDRVAGLTARQLVLKPRDDLRYGHEFWVEPESGLLLKSQLVDAQGDVVEQFAFSEVSLSPNIDQERLRSRFASEAGGWREVNARGEPLRTEDTDWLFKSAPPGFKQVSIERRVLKQGGVEAVHAIFSDGLATVSVFVEPLDANRPAPTLGESHAGPTQIYKRKLGDFVLVTALGEVPPQTVRRVAEGVEARPQ